MKLRVIMNLGLVLLGGLAIFSVYGAFLGAERASCFFQSPPMVVFWFVLIGILCSGLILFRRLWTHPFLFMIHVGSLLVLLGGLWGSREGIAFRNQHLKTRAFCKGLIPLYEGEGSSVLYDDQERPQGNLPFEIQLREFEVLYYDTPQFAVQDKTDPQHLYALPVQAGQVFSLGQGVEFSLIRSFRNLRIHLEEGDVTAAEGPLEVTNPGYEVRFILPDGRDETQYVFERLPFHGMPRYRFEIRFQPPQMPKEYGSDLIIIEEGREKAHKRIKVNHPLFYKGYLLHQQSWGQDRNGVYSVIGVVSNSGLWAVFVGYGLLAAGVAGQLWIAPVIGRIRRKEGMP